MVREEGVEVAFDDGEGGEGEVGFELGEEGGDGVVGGGGGEGIFDFRFLIFD